MIKGFISLCIAIVSITYSASAASIELPRVSEAYFSDTEASTNVIFELANMKGTWFGIVLNINAETNNTIAVEFGTDKDQDGQLSRNEIDLSLGWMCGHIFLRERNFNTGITRDVKSGHHKFEWLFRINENNVHNRLMLTDGTSLLLDHTSLNIPVNLSWNLVRIVRRGALQGSENISYSRFYPPFIIRVR